MVAFLLRKVVRYRLSTIEDNLDRVYPGMKPSEKKELIRRIYLNLSDIILEGFKGFSINKDEIMKRHKCVNGELLAEAYKNNQSVILVTGHYGNWEWGAFSPNFFVQHTIVGFFKPLANRHINEYVIRKRAKSGTMLADINDTSAIFAEYYDKRSLFLLAADQSPTKPELALWFDFLGINTPCLHGVEKYVDRHKLPVVFCKITRIKRGYYEIELDWITSPKDKLKPYGENTQEFMKRLENVIRKKPEDWLWSHRRWKHADYNKV